MPAATQMAALPAVIYTSSRADEAFLEALQEDIEPAATGTGQPAQVAMLRLPVSGRHADTIKTHGMCRPFQGQHSMRRACIGQPVWV